MSLLPIGIGAAIFMVAALAGTGSMLVRKSEQLGGLEVAYDSLNETYTVQEKMRKSNEALLAKRDKEKEKLRSETERLKRQISDEALTNEAVDNYLNTPIPPVIYGLLREQEDSGKDSEGNPADSVNEKMPRSDNAGPKDQ